MENAIGSDNQEAVRLMAELGFDVNACGMHDAARYGYLDMIKLLVDLGADVSIQDSGHGISVPGYASHYLQDHVIDYLALFAGYTVPSSGSAAQGKGVAKRRSWTCE